MESVGEYEYSKKDLIGHGAFAIVFSGRRKRVAKPDEVVAVKCINKKNLSKSQTFPEKEIEILKDLHHENVVALLYFKDTPTSLVLVMEYCNGGDLADYLHSKGTLSEDTIRLFLKQISSAMKVLHNKGIMHRDLKPQNILLSHNLKTKKPRPKPSEIKLKIADFGFARFLEADMMAATLCGSPLYMAPEVIMSQQYDGKADLWSVGTIIFQCLTGSAPFKASNPQELKNFYQRARTLEPDVPTGTSKELRDLLIRLLKKNQKDRIDFDMFFNHPFLGKSIPPTSSSSPMPVPSRTHSFSSDSPEHRTISVSPLSGNMPISSPEDQALHHHHHHHRHRKSHSPSPHRGMPKKYSASPGSAEKYGTPPSTSSLDNDILEDDYVLVSSSDLPSDMPYRTIERNKCGNPSISPSGSPHGVKFTLGSSPLRLSPTQIPMTTATTVPSPSGRPTSLPIPATSQRSNTEMTSPTRQRTPERRVSASGAILKSPKDRPDPYRTSPQSIAQFGRSSSPVSAVGLVSPSSLPCLTSPGVMHRVTRFNTSPTSPKLNVSLTPPEGANQSPVLTIEAARTSPPVRPSSGGSPTQGYSPSRRRCKASHVLSHHPLEVSTPARCPPFGFANPSNLPTILGSPTKKIGLIASPVYPGSGNETSPSQPLNAPFAMDRRTKTFSGAICDELQPRRVSSVGESGMIPRSASSGRLGDQFSLKAAFDNLAKSPAISIEALPGQVTMATSPPSYPSGMFYIGSHGSGGQRRNSVLTEGSPSSQGSVSFATSPPNMEGPIMFVAPDLPEETLLEPEHTEIVERLQVIVGVVEAIVEVAKSRSDPLAESVYTKDTEASPKDTVCFVSEGYRRAEQLVLYARALDLLSASLDMARDEISARRLQPSNAVRTIVMSLNDRYHLCLAKCRGLYDKSILHAPGVEPDTSMITADKLMYSYAIDLCQTAGLDELFGSPLESIAGYKTAQMLLHGLCLQAKTDADRDQLLKYKQLLDQRIATLDKPGASLPAVTS
ncbi:serine/threonine-protein kinase unc-51-like [Amphiura filiformis]|uniref:serine/threonine-protein kinase unc-51-like n=1 Tax=Amphiura filiformis TaxID=82378 RepID=UPI003B20BBDC